LARCAHGRLPPPWSSQPSARQDHLAVSRSILASCTACIPASGVALRGADSKD
jgi:hypothetical protein